MGIEDWSMADNLMIESAIAESGGCFVVFDAPPAELFTSLVGFEQCLQRLTAL
jgi:hypothetical protein